MLRTSFFKLHRYIITLLLVALYGCVDIKEQQYEVDRSPYYPLAVISVNTKPEFTSEADITDLDRGKGTGSCAKGIIVSFGLLAPLCILSIPQDMIVESEYEERQRVFTTKIKSLEPRLIKQTDQLLLRSHAMKYLLEKSADAYEVNQESYPVDIKERARSLKQQGYASMLELSLLSLDLIERKVLNTKNESMLCVTLKGQGRIFKNDGNQEVAVEEAQARVCRHLQELLKDGVLESELSELYSSLSKYILDEIIFNYKKSLDEVTSPSPITPKVLNDEVEVVYEDENTLEKYVVIEEQRISRHAPKLLKDFASIDGVQFTEVSKKPRFEWTTLNGQGITDVRYDLRIYSGRPITTSFSSKLHDMFSGNTYPATQYITTSELVYSRDGLETASHEIDTTLESCRWYFWTIRASFQLNGKPRVTDWSVNLANWFYTPTWYKAYYPIRTPASEEEPACWEQAVDWGPIKVKD